MDISMKRQYSMANVWEHARLLLVLIAFTLTACVTETRNDAGIRTDPEKYLKTLIDLGVGYLRNGDYQRSKEKLLLALEQDSKSSQAHTTLGLLYQIQLEKKLAEKHFKKAIRYDDENSQARMNYGAFLYAEGKYEMALEELAYAADDTTYRNQPEANENLAFCYLKLNDNRQAEFYFRKALGLNSRLARSLLAMTEMKFSESEYSDSLRYYRAFQSVSRQNARSLWMGIRLARVFGNQDEVDGYAISLEKVFPASPEYKQYKDSIQ